MPARIIDVSHASADGMVAYPGSPAPEIAERASAAKRRTGRV